MSLLYQWKLSNCDLERSFCWKHFFSVWSAKKYAHELSAMMSENTDENDQRSYIIKEYRINGVEKAKLGSWGFFNDTVKRKHSIKRKGGKLKITGFVLIVAKVTNLIKIKMNMYSCVNIHECDNKIAGNH